MLYNNEVRVLKDGKIKYNFLEKPFSMLGNYLHGKHWDRISDLYDVDNQKLSHNLGLEKYNACMQDAVQDSQTLFRESSPFYLLFTMVDFHTRVFFLKTFTKNNN